MIIKLSLLARAPIPSNFSGGFCSQSLCLAKWYSGCYDALNIDSDRAHQGFVARVWLFSLATAVVALFIVFATFSVWKHLSSLRASLNQTQSQSFDIANHFQRVFLALNSHLLQYEIKSDPAEWTSFQVEWDKLNVWIDEQRAALTAETEKVVLADIDRAFDTYKDAAWRLHDTKKINDKHPLSEFGQFQTESNHLVQLGYQLAAAHQNTLLAFYSEFSSSFTHLRILLVTAFVLLVVLSVGLWAVVYRDMIVPLRVKLVESRALLERQEKLASLGVLSAGLAHEIRNPLTAMKARLFTLGKRLEPGTPQEQDAAVISREVDRLERILKDFLEFARPSAPKFSSVKALGFLQDVRALLLPQLELQQIQLVVEDSVNPAVRVDPQQMTQVLLNLIRNAADSIGRHGLIALRVRKESVLLGGRLSDVAVLEVSDTGKGIAPEVEKRLFDPFHTTKDGGTGLGLSIAARIVERHGGALRYKTRVGHGTTFGVVLPLETNQ